MDCGASHAPRERFVAALCALGALALSGCGRIGYDLLPLPHTDGAAPSDGDPEGGLSGPDAGPDAGPNTTPDAASPDASGPVCSTPCDNPHGGADCSSGTCSLSCTSGFADCDADPENGCETDLLNDPEHCGSCIDACGTNGQVCVAGECEASPCSTGLGECDGDLAVTCETDLTADLDHCGSCANACTTSNGTPACVAGACEVQACDPGYDDCDGDPADCEVDVTGSVAHCGACNAPCSNAHGTTLCASSTCEPTCSSGWDSCDGNPDNGCETPLTTTSDCGVCGRSCPANGGTAVCEAGTCDTRCDLTGRFALYLRLSGTWPRAGVIESGSGWFEFWMQLDATHSGNDVDIQLTECGRTIPPFGAWQIDEDFLYGYPNSLFDSGGLPSSAGTISLGDSSPDGSLSLPPIATQMGIAMADPVGDPWFNQASDIPSGIRVDMDGDGRPGVTATYANGSGYVYPRTSDSFFSYNRADRAYAASRVAFSLSGSLSSCTQASGTASFTHVDTRIFDCRRSGGGGCDASEADFLDDNAQDYSLGSATFTLMKVASDASCAALRSALP